MIIRGLTSRSAARLERRLNRLDGVFAIVSHATDRATISYDQSKVSLPQVMHVAQVMGFAVETGDARQTSGTGAVKAQVDALGRPLQADTTTAELAELRARTVVAFLLAVPVLALSLTPSWQADGWQWVALIFALPVVTWAAMPLHLALFRDTTVLSDLRDFLASIGVLVMFGWSLWVAASESAGEQPYFHICVLITVIALATRWIERTGLSRAGAVSRQLSRSGAVEARIRIEGMERRIASQRLHPGDYLVVGPAEKVAADAIVVEGYSSLDVSALTGDDVPVAVGPGRPVACGSINTGDRFVARVARVGAQTGLAQAVRTVERVHAEQSSLRRRADRGVAAIVVSAVVLAGATLLTWLSLTGDIRDAVFAAVAVVLAAAPGAMATSVATPMLVGVGRGVQLGIVISRFSAVRNSRRVDAVVADRSLEHNGPTHGALTRHMRRIQVESVFMGRAGMDEAIRQLRARRFCVALALDVSGRVPPEGTIFAQAAVGVAVGAGTFGPVPGADITLARRDLGAVADGFALSQRIWRTISGNLTFTGAYHVVVLPCAAAGLLHPIAACAVGGTAGTLVVLNSLRLRRFQLSHER